MPFDSAGFPDKQPRRGRRKLSDNGACAIIITLCALMLLAPFSLAALVDIVRYLRAG